MTKKLPNNIDKYIATKLKLFRLKHNISLQTCTNLLNISSTQYQKYEAAKNKIPVNCLYLLSKSFNIPVTYFFDGIKETKASIQSLTISDKEIMLLISAYCKLKSSKQKLKFIEFLETICD